MSNLITLESLDVDGAIRESAEGVPEATRADFLKKAALGGGALIGGGALLTGFPAIATAGRPSKNQDVAILNFALTLEFLEAEFYIEALRDAGLTGDVLQTTRIVTAHERTHVKTLKRTLGGRAIKKPRFDFRNTTQDPNVFLDTAVVLEDTGVAAYSGQAARVFQPAVLKVAASILAVEARHASRFRSLNGQNFAPDAFDPRKSMSAVLKAVKKTRFIKG